MAKPARNPQWKVKDYIKDAKLRLDQLNDPLVRAATPLRYNYIMQFTIVKLWLKEQDEFREFLGIMPKKYNDDNFKGFINLKLNEAQKEMFGAWDVEDDDVWLLLSQLATEGYKFSNFYNQQNSTYTSMFTCNDKSSANAGYVLTAYSPNWYQSIRVLLFKHEVVLQRNWSSAGEVQKLDDWG